VRWLYCDRRARLVRADHTNPPVDPTSDARRELLAAGIGIAEELERVEL
jgi:hypothetical protein